MTAKPSIPKGTRDFSPSEMIRRDYIFSTIKQVFSLYGYQPLETPAMEYLSTLMGKYGDEGDKLLFRILNSGDYTTGISDEELIRRDHGRLSSKICEKGLRYDLTVPFARYVVQHQNEIVFPFKRYQIQPVWRADRPQKGRYREFFQCDVDVIGSNSLLNEYELIRIIDDIFGRLGISVTIKVNNRKILTGIAEITGQADKITDITVAIDKLDKIGMEAVVSELLERGISPGSVSILRPLIELKGSTPEKLGILASTLTSSATGLAGIDEIKTLFSYISSAPSASRVELDLTLARGLNYYTGAIIEVKANNFDIGSICGGGRYDNLAGVFGLEGVSGVGVSFGADRIYDVMSGLDLFDEAATQASKVMILNFGDKESAYALSVLSSLHGKGISAELYPDQAKIKKQMAYADSRRIPFVIIAGEDEISRDEVTIKNMASGEQIKIKSAGAAEYIRSCL